jgi:hypothetical protein
LQAVAVSADESEEDVFQVSTAPDDLRTEILVNRMASSGAIPSNLLAGAALNLPNRGIVSTQSPSCAEKVVTVSAKHAVCWSFLWLTWELPM